MKTGILSLHYGMFILAQTTGSSSLKQGLGSALSIIMLIAFIIGVVMIIGGSVNREDESRFTWIKPGTFVGMEDFHGKSCYHFRQDVALSEQSGQLAGFQQGTVHSEAWINKETLLPVGYDDAQALYLYTFQSPPTSELTLPAKYLSEKKRYENAFKAPQQLGK